MKERPWRAQPSLSKMCQTRFLPRAQPVGFLIQGCCQHGTLESCLTRHNLAVRSAVRLIGPSVILLGAAIGSGEWLLAPALTAKYAGTVLWVATVSVCLQACLNQEVSRYTLATGEPIFYRLHALLAWQSLA